MPVKKTITLSTAILSLFLFMALTTPLIGQERIKPILADADTWIISDTTRILSFIAQSNQEALEELQGSHPTGNRPTTTSAFS